MNSDLKTRKLVAPMVYEWAVQEFVEPLQKRLDNEEDKLEVKQLLASANMTEIKSLSQCLVAISLQREEREINQERANRQAKLDAFAANDAPVVLPVDNDPDYSANIAFEVTHLVGWISRNESFYENSPVGQATISLCVPALAEHWEVLENYEAMCEYLVTDFTALKESPFLLSEQEETAVLYALIASLTTALASKKEKGKGVSERAPKAKRCLIKFLFGLLTKYCREFRGLGLSRLNELIILARSVDLRDFVELRMITVKVLKIIVRSLKRF